MRISVWTSVALGAVFLGACSSEPIGEPGDVGGVVEQRLDPVGAVTPVETNIEHQIFSLNSATMDGDVTWDSCNAVNDQLNTICNDLVASGETQYCGQQASFFFANNTPRCAVRLELFRDEDYDQGKLSRLYALDFSGEPVGQAATTCGNGELDEGEECDDGNHEMWDGCDAQCILEPFNGCEAVIENYYQQAGLAVVKQDKWQGLRSHLMVNRSATSLTPMSKNTCNAIIATGEDVCNELTQQMPFVSYCWPQGEYHDNTCSVRLNVGFHQLSPTDGVYTTGLQGILAFSVK